MENIDFQTHSGLCLPLDRDSVSRTVIRTRLGDNNAHKLDIVLFSGGEKMTLPADSTVTMFSVRPDGTSVWSPCTVNEDGTVTHIFTSGELSVTGRLECELHIVTEESEMTTPRFRITVDRVIRDDETVQASDDYSALGSLIRQTRELIPETDEILCGDGEGGIEASGIGIGEFEYSGGIRHLVTYSGGNIEGNTYRISNLISDNSQNTQFPTAKAVHDYVKSEKKEYVTSTIPGSATVGERGDILLHSVTGIFYKCVNAEGGVYTWEQMIMPEAFVIPYAQGLARTWYKDEIRTQMDMMHYYYTVADTHDIYTQAGFAKNGNILNTLFRVYAAQFMSDNGGNNVRTVVYPAFYYEGTGDYSTTLRNQPYRAVGFISPGIDNDSYLTTYTVKCWQITKESYPPIAESYPIEFTSSGSVMPVDDVPTVESSNAVSSDGVKSALDTMQTKGISDEGGYYQSDTVEGILQEIGEVLSGMEDAFGTIVDVIGGDGE